MAAPATGQPNFGAGQSNLLQDISFPPLNQCCIGQTSQLENLNLTNESASLPNDSRPYDMLPKHCKQCKVQGYDDEACRNLHPELSKIKRPMIRRWNRRKKAVAMKSRAMNLQQQEEESFGATGSQSILKNDMTIELIRELRIKGIKEKDISTKNAFDALTEKNEKDHPNESTRGTTMRMINP
ncbi:hypothetical protein RDI58_017771 [Solanum bulbocastanum]|uniref:Uncharacterized protein n=1 Tax=Solanum bulbocastanum TaxID=147425 RepID=A0AAN8YAA5_SOLBU